MATRLPSLLLLVAISGHPIVAQSGGPQPPSLPLGAGRPAITGIVRTPLRDDAKATVTRVRFEPHAEEPPHTHPTDVILVPVLSGSVELKVGDVRITALAAGEVQFIPRNVTHHLKNTGSTPFEVIAIALK